MLTHRALLAATLAVASIVISPSHAATLTPLYSFSNGANPLTPTDGAGPDSPLVIGPGGNYYSTTSQGGAYGYGTLYQVTPKNIVTTLYSYTGFNADGAVPLGGVFPGINSHGFDGSLYGTTSQGGSFGNGTVYKITPGVGVPVTLHSFKGGAEGAYPASSVVESFDGNFYGTTYSGGLNGSGTIYKISSTGVFTTLHSFTSAEGVGPLASLLPDGNGGFYGTTNSGGQFNFGTIFRADTAGNLQVLHAFGGPDGANPAAALFPGFSNYSVALYGTTQHGGAASNGTVFKLGLDGSYTLLHSFTAINPSGVNVDGAFPASNLFQGCDGGLYSTTAIGGTYGAGTIYRITTGGTLTSIYAFTGGADGGSPQAGLFPNSSKTFLGAAASGGTYGVGTLFSIQYR